MTEAEKIKNQYKRILKIYNELDVIKEVRYRLESDQDGKLKEFLIYVIPKNRHLVRDLCRSGWCTISEAFEETLSYTQYLFCVDCNIRIVVEEFPKVDIDIKNMDILEIE